MPKYCLTPAFKVAVENELEFTIAITDDSGKEILRAGSFLNLNINEFLVNDYFNLKIASPLIHEQSGTWFYPAGFIKIVASNNNSVAISQNDIVLFEFTGNLIEFKTISQGNFLLLHFFLLIF